MSRIETSRLQILAFLAIWARCAAIYAYDLPGAIPAEPGTEQPPHIAVEASYEPGEKIAPTLEGVVLEGATASYAWSHPGIDPGNVEAVDGGRRLLVWAPSRAEPYRLTCYVTYTLEIPQAEGEPKRLTLPPYTYDASFTVTGAPEPGPPPTPKTLAELAGADAAALAAFYADFRKIVPLLSTSDTVRTTHEQGLKLKGLSENGAKREIATRFDAVVPTETTTLTDELRSSIDAMFAKVVEDLGAKPTPVVVEGKRRVVILHETADNTPEFSQFIVKLRGQDVEQYLRSKGHRLDILDDDQVASDGNADPLVVRLKGLGVALPSLFILDLADERVIHSQSLPSPATAAAVMEVLKNHGG